MSPWHPSELVVLLDARQGVWRERDIFNCSGGYGVVGHFVATIDRRAGECRPPRKIKVAKPRLLVDFASSGVHERLAMFDVAFWKVPVAPGP